MHRHQSQHDAQWRVKLLVGTDHKFLTRVLIFCRRVTNVKTLVRSRIGVLELFTLCVLPPHVLLTLWHWLPHSPNSPNFQLGTEIIHALAQHASLTFQYTGCLTHSLLPADLRVLTFWYCMVLKSSCGLSGRNFPSTTGDQLIPSAAP